MISDQSKLLRQHPRPQQSQATGLARDHWSYLLDAVNLYY